MDSTLFENPLFSIWNLRVQARDGIVTLQGIVYHIGEKRLTDRLGAMVPGVGRVVNKIEVFTWPEANPAFRASGK